jgi:hypothetical protein
MRRILPWTVLAMLFAASAWASVLRWELITEDEGIRVWQRPVPGTSLVEFRGKADVPANIRRVLAVFQDHRRKVEWLDGSVDHRLLRAFKPGKVIVYNRTGSPYPFIDDRDVVLETELSIGEEKKQIRIDAWSVDYDRFPPIDGVVRMPKVMLSWILVAKDPNTTEVTYEVRADPGGEIPKWLVNLAAKSLPFKTLGNLRRQIKKNYERELAIVEASWDWDRSGL